MHANISNEFRSELEMNEVLKFRNVFHDIFQLNILNKLLQLTGYWLIKPILMNSKYQNSAQKHSMEFRINSELKLSDI